MKCKVEWVGKEEQTWEPSHRFRHTSPYKDFQKSLNPQSDISNIEYEVEDIRIILVLFMPPSTLKTKTMIFPFKFLFVSHSLLLLDEIFCLLNLYLSTSV